MIMRTILLYPITALAEIIGCYLPLLWLRQGKSIWLLIPSTFSLALFVWLLTLHETSAGRIYAAYGGVYIVTALFWMWIVEGLRPDQWDIIGACIILIGSGVIILSPHSS